MVDSISRVWILVGENMWEDILKQDKKMFSDLREQLDLFEEVLLNNKQDSTIGFNIRIFEENVKSLVNSLKGRLNR